MKKINKILLFITLMFVGILNVSAAELTRTKDDLGVNKKWKITEDNIDAVLKTPLVDASKKIYDYAEILDEEDETSLYLQAQTFLSNTDTDIVILTTNLSYNDSQLEDYAADFYDYNDFGIDFEHYNGIVLIINTNYFNRFYNIYTFGEAILYYDDERIENMLDYIFDDIKAGDYNSGVSNFMKKALDLHNEGIPECNKNAYITDDGNIKYRYTVPFLAAFLISFVITLIITLVFIGKNKMVKKAKAASEYLDKNSINYTKKTDTFVHTHTTSYTINTSSGGSGGGSSTHIGSSGGFHGGGGGRHF